MEIEIRPESPDDYTGIRLVCDLAFGRPNEGEMVTALRHNPRFIKELSLVAQAGGTVVGHILFFPIDIVTPDGPVPSLSLAPLAVYPEYQNMGIGGKLIEAGIGAARSKGFASIILVGHPGYYPRFGFEPAVRWGIRPLFDAPREAFMALALSEGGLEGISGVVAYPPEYDAAM
jgi:putative acetyltransferase